MGLDLGPLERAHGAMNAAYNAIAVDRQPATLQADVERARGYVHEAHAAIVTQERLDGPDTRAAARAVLPRLDHALQLLEALGTDPDPIHLTVLLGVLGAAMDHVEAVLAGAGRD